MSIARSAKCLIIHWGQFLYGLDNGLELEAAHWPIKRLSKTSRPHFSCLCVSLSAPSTG